jgi:hypothetical protein
MGRGGAGRGDDQTAQAIDAEIGLGALGNELLAGLCTVAVEDRARRDDSGGSGARAGEQVIAADLWLLSASIICWSWPPAVFWSTVWPLWSGVNCELSAALCTSWAELEIADSACWAASSRVPTVLMKLS